MMHGQKNIKFKFM